MKKILVSILVIFFLGGLLSPSHAVENGDDATGSSFVVPISWDLGNGKWGACSGTLIAPSIAVTAGHCVLDSNGLLTKNVYVGIAGSSQSSINLSDKIASVQITSTFQSGAEGKVGDDDLAFLTLGKPQALRVPIILASEKQVTDFKSKGIALKSFGYGNYTNAGTENITFPKSFDGTFSPVNSTYSNSAYMISTKGRSCTGDSGAPILNISATQVTLVGILTGSTRSGNDQCGQKFTDGNYYTLFTLVGRYANLAFAAATDVMNSQIQTISSQNNQIVDKDSQLLQANSSLSSVRSDLDSAKKELEDLQQKLDAANSTILTLNKKLPQTIVCVKGKLTKNVTAVNPVCPAGYKKK
jgi:V8-like Glu-specific endopeptidase